jgi:hypothetical protein
VWVTCWVSGVCGGCARARGVRWACRRVRGAGVCDRARAGGDSCVGAVKVALGFAPPFGGSGSPA